jgi:hemerythrin
MKFSWQESYAIHVEEVDAQHQWLIDIMNVLHEHVLEARSHRSLEIVLDSLALYTQTHFSTEEQLMATYNYPDQVEHKAEHAEFVQQLYGWQTGFRERRLELSDEIAQFLQAWLKQHILDVDSKLGLFLISHGVN